MRAAVSIKFCITRYPKQRISSPSSRQTLIWPRQKWKDQKSKNNWQNLKNLIKTEKRVKSHVCKPSKIIDCSYHVSGLQSVCQSKNRKTLIKRWHNTFPLSLCKMYLRCTKWIRCMSSFIQHITSRWNLHVWVESSREQLYIELIKNDRKTIIDRYAYSYHLLWKIWLELNYNILRIFTKISLQNFLSTDVHTRKRKFSLLHDDPL